MEYVVRHRTYKELFEGLFGDNDPVERYVNANLYSQGQWNGGGGGGCERVKEKKVIHIYGPNILIKIVTRRLPPPPSPHFQTHSRSLTSGGQMTDH